MSHWSASLYQGDMMVAGVTGPTEDSVTREIQHYAMMYAQDGEPVAIKIKPPRKRKAK